MSDYDYIQTQQRKFEDYAENYRRDTNEASQRLAHHLVLVATVFLSISPFVLSTDSLLDKMSLVDRYLLSKAWVALTLSLAFGVVQSWIDIKFFQSWMKAKFSVVSSIYSNASKWAKEPDPSKIAKELSEIAKKEQKDIPDKSFDLFFWLQVLFLAIGMGLLTSVTAGLIF